MGRLVSNESTKLTATYINGIAIAVLQSVPWRRR
jgi:hypothetical protein